MEKKMTKKSKKKKTHFVVKVWKKEQYHQISSY